MKCPMCKREQELTPDGRFPMHRITDEHRHRWSFCDMSGESAELAARNEVA